MCHAVTSTHIWGSLHELLIFSFDCRLYVQKIKLKMLFARKVYVDMRPSVPHMSACHCDVAPRLCYTDKRCSQRKGFICKKTAYVCQEWRPSLWLCTKSFVKIIAVTLQKNVYFFVFGTFFLKVLKSDVFYLLNMWNVFQCETRNTILNPFKIKHITHKVIDWPTGRDGLKFGMQKFGCYDVSIH